MQPRCARSDEWGSGVAPDSLGKASPAEEGAMARNFYRALVYSSLFAGIGSFLIEVGQAADRISAFVTSKLQELSAADRDWTTQPACW
jgi:hypothetical protein